MEPSSKSTLAWIIVVLIGGGGLFLAWDRFGTGGGSSLAGGQGIFDQIAGISSPWTLTEKTDPMTDERILSANRQLEADGFMIETDISCRTSEALLTYTFTTFDGDGAPAEFKQLLGGTTMNVVAFHVAKLRPDSGEPQIIKDTDPRFTNSFKVQLLSITENTPEHIRQDRMFAAEMAQVAELASAQNLTVRFPLMQGDVVFQVDQTDALVAQVIEACLQNAIPITPRAAQGAQAANPSTLPPTENSQDGRAPYSTTAPPGDPSKQGNAVFTSYGAGTKSGDPSQSSPTASPPPQSDREAALREELRIGREQDAAADESARRQQQDEANQRAARYEANRAAEQAKLCASI